MNTNNSASYADDAKHIGDNFFTSLSALEQAIEQIKRKLGSEDRVVEIIENLEDYLMDYPNRKIIGLEQKLIDGSREDLKDRAILLKSRFERKLAKNQMLLAEQHVYVQLLSEISTIWHSKIKPLIDSKAPNHTIDEAIYNDLIEPVHKAAVRYDTLATKELVTGMLYFLTGKCHLVWSQSC